MYVMLLYSQYFNFIPIECDLGGSFNLNEIRGVGPKIADCVLLFAFEKLDAFPIDRWIARAIFSNYLNKISYKETATSERISLSFEKPVFFLNFSSK